MKSGGASRPSCGGIDPAARAHHQVTIPTRRSAIAPRPPARKHHAVLRLVHLTLDRPGQDRQAHVRRGLGLRGRVLRCRAAAIRPAPRPRGPGAQGPERENRAGEPRGRAADIPRTHAVERGVQADRDRRGSSRPAGGRPPGPRSSGPRPAGPPGSRPSGRPPGPAGRTAPADRRSRETARDRQASGPRPSGHQDRASGSAPRSHQDRDLQAPADQGSRPGSRSRPDPTAIRAPGRSASGSDNGLAGGLRVAATRRAAAAVQKTRRTRRRGGGRSR